MPIELGLKATHEDVATPEKCTKHTNPNAPGLYSTPSMVGFIESTCSRVVKDMLEEGQSTVGTAVNIRHLAPTREGQGVRCEAELTEIDRRRLQFTVSVYNEEGVLIGDGTHDRFIITPKREG